MLSSKIENVRAALGELAGRVDHEQWQIIRNCRAVLEAVQENAEALENGLITPEADQPQAATA